MAYYIYLAEGRPEGKSVQHWLEAEEQLEVECQFKAESRLEPNLFDDGAVKRLNGQESVGLNIPATV